VKNELALESETGKATPGCFLSYGKSPKKIVDLN
jgi:hypothetical protein